MWSLPPRFFVSERRRGFVTLLHIEIKKRRKTHEKFLSEEGLLSSLECTRKKKRRKEQGYEETPRRLRRERRGEEEEKGDRIFLLSSSSSSPAFLRFSRRFCSSSSSLSKCPVKEEKSILSLDLTRNPSHVKQVGLFDSCPSSPSFSKTSLSSPSPLLPSSLLSHRLSSSVLPSLPSSSCAPSLASSSSSSLCSHRLLSSSLSLHLFTSSFSFTSSSSPPPPPRQSSSPSSFQRRYTKRSSVMEEDFDGPIRSGQEAKDDRHAWFDSVHPLPPGGPSWMNRYYGYLGRIRSSSSSKSSSSPAPSISRELDWDSRRVFLGGHVVPYKFRISDIPSSAHGHRPPSERLGVLNRQTDPTLEYTDFSQNRFPVLNTAENFRYWKDRGIDRVLPRVFPIKLPAHRRIDPLLREYIYFLHSLDPARFSERKLGERYGLRERTVQLVLREFSVAEFLRRTELATPTTRRLSREKSVLKAKEILFGTKLGMDQTQE
ncbi:hypothetical protein CSUI_003565 [Cystoisospora suis]|uniref:Uncharacterized protein n=1 Tax=Cystoisospora suis TaxID=483139 RepID=A0A2C6L4D4_9APIC|nr:hypothetical protein CSUI_003565 [Cystoisospora suis]